MTLEDRLKETFIVFDAVSVEVDENSQRWVDMALAYNATLPAKPAKKKQRS
jgi:hypothetical protein